MNALLLLCSWQRIQTDPPWEFGTRRFFKKQKQLRDRLTSYRVPGKHCASQEVPIYQVCTIKEPSILLNRMID